MNRTEKSRRLGKLIGRKNVARLQSYLKFLLNFRNDYRRTSFTDVKHPTVVFCIDGKTIHGGLSDRLRGLLSTYMYCLSRGKNLVVNWTYPFKLSDYLIINDNVKNVKWGGYLSHDKNEVAFRFFNSYSHMNNDEKSYFKLLDTKMLITHVYSNVTLHEEFFSKYFNKLFSPTEKLQGKIDDCVKEIGGRYVSITFRFIGLLGDFVDTYMPNRVLNEEQKDDYINHGLYAIKMLWNEYHNDLKGILVTADSDIFLERAKKLSFVYVIPGKIVHIDGTDTSAYDAYEKTFLDFFMIAKAEDCYCYQYGKMFGATKFARTAALLGGKNIKVNKCQTDGRNVWGTQMAVSCI